MVDSKLENKARKRIRTISAVVSLLLISLFLFLNGGEVHVFRDGLNWGTELVEFNVGVPEFYSHVIKVVEISGIDPDQLMLDFFSFRAMLANMFHVFVLYFLVVLILSAVRRNENLFKLAVTFGIITPLFGLVYADLVSSIVVGHFNSGIINEIKNMGNMGWGYALEEVGEILVLLLVSVAFYLLLFWLLKLNRKRMGIV